jgi:hypothetical protein
VAQRFSAARTGVLILAGILASTACDDGGSGTRTGELVSSPSASLAARVSPSQLQLSPIVASGCPVSQPFTTHMDLVVGPFATDLALDTVTLRFDDAANGLLIFTKNDLDRMFGTAQIPARTIQVFAMDPQFGCGLSTRPRALAAGIDTFDTRGQRHQATASATFR